MPRLSPRVAALVLGALACTGGEDAPPAAGPGGTLVIATSGEPDHVLPLLVTTLPGKQAADALFLPIARIGDRLNMLGDEGFTGVLAERWEWSADSLSITFHLDPAARWHDGTPLRTGDVAFSFDLYRDPRTTSPFAGPLSGITALTVVDSLAFTITWGRRTASQFYDFAYNFAPVPRHVFGTVAPESLATHAVARAPIGSGKFRFSRWDAGRQLEVVADTGHWLGRPSLDRVIWNIVPDPATQVAQLIAGEADVVEVLRGAFLTQAAADTSLRFAQRAAYDFGMGLFNFRDPTALARPHPLFGDRRVRAALLQALDRPTMVRAVLDSLGLAMESPLVSSMGIRGPTLPPTDLVAAGALLDSAGFTGWDNGIRTRGTTRLAFSITVPPSSATRARLAELLRDAWGKMGAQVTIRASDFATQVEEARAGKFDVSLVGFTSEPSPRGLREFWGSSMTDDGTNWGHYASAAFDATIDSARFAADPIDARQLYARASGILVQDLPAVWLYELRSVMGMHRRLRPAPMRADAWWAHLDEWSVDPAALLPRDRLGATPAAGTAPTR